MIEFQKYAEVKDNYCLCYFGYSDEYLVQLRLLKPVFQHRFPGLNICFGCKDNKTHLLAGCEPILTISRIKVDRNHYAHIRELRYNGRTHPIEDLLIEADIQTYVISNPQPRMTSKCVLITQGNHPTKSLDQEQIAQMKAWAEKTGYEVECDVAIEHAGLVAGVESPQLFEAAGRGIHTILVPTGVGTTLYKTMFPQGEVWSLFV